MPESDALDVIEAAHDRGLHPAILRRHLRAAGVERHGAWSFDRSGAETVLSEIDAEVN